MQTLVGHFHVPGSKPVAGENQFQFGENFRKIYARIPVYKEENRHMFVFQAILGTGNHQQVQSSTLQRLSGFSEEVKCE